MIETLPDKPLDIIGDIHGEADALTSLLHHLGYDEWGNHPQGRHAVFVGDLCDRGPDTPAVIDKVRRIVEAGNGHAIIGNHELNILRGECKDGAGWFWGEEPKGGNKYEPFVRLSPNSRQAVLDFFGSLPIALEREDIRIIHAVWYSPSLKQLKLQMNNTQANNTIAELFEYWDKEAERELEKRGLLEESQKEQARWKDAIGDPEQAIPLLAATGLCDEIRQMANPLRVLTSGIERQASTPFYSSGKWRFAVREKWWDKYEEETPVVVGHYWRRFVEMDRQQLGKGDPDLFEAIQPTHWHGARRNVFCVDFSVGGRFHERRSGQAIGSITKLAALRWPERTLMLETGEELNTE